MCNILKQETKKCKEDEDQTKPIVIMPILIETVFTILCLCSNNSLDMSHGRVLAYFNEVSNSNPFSVHRQQWKKICQLGEFL